MDWSVFLSTIAQVGIAIVFVLLAYVVITAIVASVRKNIK